MTSRPSPAAPQDDAIDVIILPRAAPQMSVASLPPPIVSDARRPATVRPTRPASNNAPVSPGPADAKEIPAGPSPPATALAAGEARPPRTNFGPAIDLDPCGTPQSRLRHPECQTRWRDAANEAGEYRSKRMREERVKDLAGAFPSSCWLTCPRGGLAPVEPAYMPGDRVVKPRAGMGMEVGGPTSIGPDNPTPIKDKGFSDAC